MGQLFRTFSELESAEFTNRDWEDQIPNVLAAVQQLIGGAHQAVDNLHNRLADAGLHPKVDDKLKEVIHLLDEAGSSAMGAHDAACDWAQNTYAPHFGGNG